VVNYAGSSSAADDVVAELTSAGGSAVALKADVADETAVSVLFDMAEQAMEGSTS
jgi:3-oxoacyl-[acyl-carrier protein] reductase